MKSLIFTAESSYARFRCPYSTTSALTFLAIHPLAVKGLIGAIFGIEYSQLYDFSKNMKIGIQVLKEVYKDMQSFNLIAQTNNNNSANFQSRVQFLRDVEYRLFISDDDNKLDKLASILQSHEFVFTPYLGCSEHIAKLTFEGIYETYITEEQPVDTIVPKQSINYDHCGDIHLYLDRIPVRNNSFREYIEYSNVAFAPSERIPVKESKIYKVGDYNVFFL